MRVRRADAPFARDASPPPTFYRNRGIADVPWPVGRFVCRSWLHQSSMKSFLVAAAFVLIIGSMISALYFMNHDRGTTKRMVWSLAARVGLSITLFLSLLAAYWFGWIEPTGLPIGR